MRLWMEVFGTADVDVCHGARREFPGWDMHTAVGLLEPFQVLSSGQEIRRGDSCGGGSCVILFCDRRANFIISVYTYARVGVSSLLTHMCDLSSSWLGRGQKGKIVLLVRDLLETKQVNGCKNNCHYCVPL